MMRRICVVLICFVHADCHHAGTKGITVGLMTVQSGYHTAAAVALRAVGTVILAVCLAGEVGAVT